MAHLLRRLLSRRERNTTPDGLLQVSDHAFGEGAVTSGNTSPLGLPLVWS